MIVDVSSKTEFQADLTAMPAKLCSLPPLNSIATRVLALSDDPDMNTRSLAAAIEGDPAFAAEVLFLANSPLFGFPSKLQVLPHAIAILGVERVKALAATVAMRAFVGGGGSLIRSSWRHSAACAVIAEQISPAFRAPGDQAYCAALMHDIGRLALLKTYPRQMGPVLAGDYGDSREALYAERAAIQVDHQSAGAWLVQQWALPPSFAEVCQHHHDPVQASDPVVLQVVKTACRMADALGCAAAVCTNPIAYAEMVEAAPEGVQKVRLPGEAQLRQYVEERLASFESQG